MIRIGKSRKLNRKRAKKLLKNQRKVNKRSRRRMWKKRMQSL